MENIESTIDHSTYPTIIKIIRRGAIIKIAIALFWLAATIFYVFQSTLLIARVQSDPGYFIKIPYSTLIIFGIFIIAICFTILFDSRVLFYLKNRDKRARRLLIFTLPLSIAVFNFIFFAETIGTATNNEILRSVAGIDYLPFLSYPILVVVFLSDLIILGNFFLSFYPTTKSYFSETTTPVSSTSSWERFWTGPLSNIFSIAFLVVALTPIFLDATSISCLGVVKSPESCFAKEAVQKNDVTSCEKAIEPAACYRLLARQNPDLRNCSNVADEKISLSCVYEYIHAGADINAQICQGIKAKTGREECYLRLGPRILSEDVCKLISDNDRQRSCLQFVQTCKSSTDKLDRYGAGCAGATIDSLSR